MDSLFYLLGVKPEENMELTDWSVGFREIIPLWLGLFILALGITWSFFIYFNERGTLGWPRRVLGALLRSTLIAIVVFFLMKPVLLVVFTGKEECPVVLLMDNSQSLQLVDRRVTQEDKARTLIARNKLSATAGLDSDFAKDAVRKEYKDDPSRLQLLQATLNHPEWNLLEGIAQRGKVEAYLFGAKTHGLRDPASKGEEKPLKDRVVDAIKGNEARTAVVDLVREAMQKKNAVPPAAIVVFTDGRDNHSKFAVSELLSELNALHGQDGESKDAEARATPDWHKVPLHIVGLGTPQPGLLRFKQLRLPETLFAGDMVTVPLQFQSQGLGKEKIEISATLSGVPIKLKDRGKDKDKLEFIAPDGEDLRQELTFEVPKGEGKDALKDLVVHLKVAGDKKYHDFLKSDVQIVDEKIKVLYIENNPRFQFKFLQQALLRDRRIEPSFLLFQADKEAARLGPLLSEFPQTRKEFFDARYNVIILGDVPPKRGDKGHLTDEQMEWIKEFVQKRGGLIAIAGRNAMPHAYVGTPLEEVLPIVVAKKGRSINPDERTQEWPATLTEVGLRRPTMLFLEDTFEENQKAWEELKGFHWHYPVEKLRPGAEVLMINPRAKMGEEPMPILVSQFYGDLGQVLFLGSDETWRWRYNVEDKHFSRFWGQVLLEMGKSTLGTNMRRVHMELAGSQAFLDKETRIYARFLDKDFLPIKDAEVEATLKFLDAGKGGPASETIKFLRQKDGRYLTSVNLNRPGKYEVILTNPENASFPFRVDPPPRIDFKALAEDKDSPGAIRSWRHELDPVGMAMKDLQDLADASGGRFYREEDLRYLPNSITPQTVPFVRKQEVLLWNWLFFTLFLLVITGEWLLRKFSNLS